MRHCEFASYAGDVDDGGLSIPPGKWSLRAKVGQSRSDCVDGRKEIDFEAAFESFRCLGFDWTDLDNAGVIHKHVDVAEAGKRLRNQTATFGLVAEVRSDEIEIFRPEVGVRSRNVAGARSSSSRLRAARTRRTGRPAKREAMASPRPRDPPVMSTTASSGKG